MADFIARTIGDKQSPLDQLRVSDVDRTLALDAIRRATTPSGAERRDSERQALVDPPLIDLDIFDLRHQPHRSRVRPRDLSDSGLSFLHRGPVHPGVPCRVFLPHPDGKPRRVGARVMRCEAVVGGVHHVAICFDQPIDAFSVIQAVQAQRTRPTGPDG